MVESKAKREFLWGVASSAFQIEGGDQDDGRGDSIWDAFCRMEGRIHDNSDGRIACDHYHRYEEDLDLMQELGIDAYRFSIAWPRILPSGRGEINQKGVDFYNRLIDAMLLRGIKPWVTLYHWDLPLALHQEGGWLNREVCDAFVEYTEVVARAFGDRVKHWITHNEPWCAAVLGHRIGEHAPGTQSGADALRASHHILLSHGLAVNRLRDLCPDSQIGITLNFTPSYATNSELHALQQARDFDGDFNRWYADPIFRGSYPKDVMSYYEAQGFAERDKWSFIKDGDLEAINENIDFLGVNYYTRANFSVKPSKQDLDDSSKYTAMGWEIYPNGLSDLLIRLDQEYKVPAYYITENGAAFQDVEVNGKVADQPRIKYLKDHLNQVDLIRDRGIPLNGYFAWSILDNFEWAHGYEKRFGLVWVDYETQKRIPKDSFYWYQSRIKLSRDLEAKLAEDT